MEHLEEEYMKAEAMLTISEPPQLKQDLEKREKQHDFEWSKVRLELLEEKQRNRELEEELTALSARGGVLREGKER